MDFDGPGFYDLLQNLRDIGAHGGPERDVKISFVLVTVLLSTASVAASAADLRPTPLDDEAPFRRFLWVTRWDYRSPEDVERICYHAASARFTDLLFQVRGEGTVFFDSPYEPWAWELSGQGSPKGVGQDPGWDPLDVAIREGRRRGLRVHAYVNVLPAWAQKDPPPRSSAQLYVSRPNWLMVDSRGKRMEPNGFYAFLDPGLPEVREYLALLFARLVQDYAVDGLHLDYIRYPNESGDYSYHPRVVRDFREWYGKSPSEAPEKWVAYRQRQISSTVQQIRTAVEQVRPGLEISAAVLADPETGSILAGQLPMQWLADGLIDAVAPMVYADQMDRFVTLAEPYLDASIRSKVWLGIRAIAENHSLLDEIRLVVSKGVAGVAIFSFQELFPNHEVSNPAVRVYRTFVTARPGMMIPALPPSAKLKTRAPEVKTRLSDRLRSMLPRPEPQRIPLEIKRRSPGLKARIP